jgi:hypothetical protein
MLRFQVPKLGKDEEEIKIYQHLIERPIKLRVAKLLKVLIDTYYTEFSPQLKELLSIFIVGIADPEYSATLRKSMEKGVRKLTLNPTTKSKIRNQKSTIKNQQSNSELFSKLSHQQQQQQQQQNLKFSSSVLFKSIVGDLFVIRCFIRLNWFVLTKRKLSKKKKLKMKLRYVQTTQRPQH